MKFFLIINNYIFELLSILIKKIINIYNFLYTKLNANIILIAPLPVIPVRSTKSARRAASVASEFNLNSSFATYTMKIKTKTVYDTNEGTYKTTREVLKDGKKIREVADEQLSDIKRPTDYANIDLSLNTFSKGKNVLADEQPTKDKDVVPKFFLFCGNISTVTGMIGFAEVVAKGFSG
jgi:hypothetical protein